MDIPECSAQLVSMSRNVFPGSMEMVGGMMHTECMCVVRDRGFTYKTASPNGARGFHRDTKECVSAVGLGFLFFFFFFCSHPYLLVMY